MKVERLPNLWPASLICVAWVMACFLMTYGMHHQLEELVPENRVGKPVDLEHLVTLPTLEKAFQLFEQGRNRLFTPSGWRGFAGIFSAEFRLLDMKGQELNHRPNIGDFIRIDIPGPGGRQGGGYDWVQVEDVREYGDPGAATEAAGFRVRTANRPGKSHPTPAHFFAGGATSTFMIERHDKTVTTRYAGRNEVPNTTANKVVDQVRNTIVAAGALAGASNLQWAALIRGWLATDHQ